MWSDKHPLRRNQTPEHIEPGERFELVPRVRCDRLLERFCHERQQHAFADVAVLPLQT